jgi:hypothetical protein
MFDFSEEALDRIAVAVQEGAEGEAFLAVRYIALGRVVKRTSRSESH